MGNLGFSDMPEGEYNLDASFVQVTSRAAASMESGVRARWVELPDCRHWCNHLDDDGKPNDPAGDGQPGAIYIPLRDDLVQLDFMEAHDKKWVELPDCAGAGDEIILAADLANASVATCKTRPA